MNLENEWNLGEGCAYIVHREESRFGSFDMHRRASCRPSRRFRRASCAGTIPFVVYLGDRRRLEVDTAGKQRYLSGYDGTIAWELDPGKKPQIFTGSDALTQRRDADLYYWTRISTYFRSMEVAGIETFAGHRCYHVRGVTLWGNVNNQYFDVQSGLLIGYGFHQWVNGAPEAADTRQIFERYTTVDGVLVPMQQTAYRNGERQVVVRYESARFDTVDPRIFTPPPAVRAAANAQ
jgi:hypothetical protein